MTIADPPEFLFKAVDMELSDIIFRRGLNRLKMPFIDMYETETEARRAYTKKKTPYMFAIRSRAMYEDGFKFYLLETGTWGTDDIPQRYLLLHG